MIALTEHSRGTVLPVKAQPGARRNAILGERSEALRVAVTAAPERGRANAAIVEILAESLDLKGFCVHLITGETSRDKRFLVEDIRPDDLRSRLDAFLAKPTP